MSRAARHAALALVAVAVAVAASAGCVRTRDCRPGTLLLELSLPGDLQHADQLRVSVSLGDGGTPRDSQVPLGGALGTGLLEVTFPRYPEGRRVAVAVTALRAGVPVGQGRAVVDMLPGCSRAVLVLEPIACRAAPAANARTDFYVDEHAAAVAVTPTGESDCPYPSISAAIAAAGSSTAAAKTIHVAAGTYSVATTHESFPLELRHGLSLVGAGVGATSIIGSAHFDHSAAGGIHADGFVTLLVGDRIGTQTLRGFTVAGPAGREMYASGIFCDRGNVPQATSPSAPFPEPNLIVDEVKITDFWTGIDVGTSDLPAPTGCNARITRSELVACQAGGVFAAGSGTADGSNLAVGVALELGDGTEAGANQLSDDRTPDQWGAGVLVWDGVRRLAVRHNVFATSDWGLAIEQHGTGMVADVEGNSFSGMSRGGMRVTGKSTLRTLTRNYFAGAAAGSKGGCGDGRPGCGLLLDHDADLIGPQIERARDNVFVGNQVGLLITDSVAARVLDFGSAGDPGNNSFICNSRSADAPGYDVWAAQATTDLTLRFAGNRWDHLPPTQGAAGAPDRTDLLLEGGAVTVDTSDAVLHHMACPVGHDG